MDVEKLIKDPIGALLGEESGGSSGGGGVDTSDATATAADVSAGAVFYGASGRDTGTMPDVTPTKSENVVTVPAGRIREKQTVTVAEAKEPTVDGNVVTVHKGYVKSEKTVSVEVDKVEFYQCADVAQGAQYYEVSGATAFPECNGNYYLTDIISPIDGVSPVHKHETKTMYLFGAYEIVQITPDYTGNSGNLYHAYGYTGGTFPASGWEDVDSTDYGLSVALKTAPPTEKTWSGYKAVWSDKDGYTLEETATAGLSYGTGFTPKLGGIYNETATIEITKLFEAVKPITTNDTACLIYIDGTILSNQALAPNAHAVTFGSGVSVQGGYLVLPDADNGRITTLSKLDGFGGNLKEWTWDFFFVSDASYLCSSGRSNDYWALEGQPGSSLYFRGQDLTGKKLGVNYIQNELVGVSMQWDDGILHVWDKGKYVGACTPTFTSSIGISMGLGNDTDAGTNRMVDKLKLFRFSQKARYTPGVDFELPEGFI